MAFKTYAYFFVRNFEGAAEQISELLQLSPTRTGLKGEPNPRVANLPWKFSTWELRSPLPETEMFQDSHISALLEILESKRERVREAIAKFECGLQGVGYYTDEHPGFHLDAQLISRVAEFGLSIDFDLYCLCDHDSPDA